MILPRPDSKSLVAAGRRSSPFPHAGGVAGGNTPTLHRHHKGSIRKLRAQLKEVGLEPLADDPLLAGDSSQRE
jgi:hypothetical protein